jgi:hypothetical protein
MPPLARFTTEEILQASFSILRKSGIQDVTARSIAVELGSSTSPIYTALKSMDNLISELQKRTIAVLNEYQSRVHLQNPFLSQAIGYIAFARAERSLFRFIAIEAPIKLEESSNLQNINFPDEDIKKQWFGGLDDTAIKTITLKSYYFVYGLALSIAFGSSTTYSDDELILLLRETGLAFIQFEKIKGEQHK